MHPTQAIYLIIITDLDKYYREIKRFHGVRTKYLRKVVELFTLQIEQLTLTD